MTKRELINRILLGRVLATMLLLLTVVVVQFSSWALIPAILIIVSKEIYYHKFFKLIKENDICD